MSVWFLLVIAFFGFLLLPLALALFAVARTTRIQRELQSVQSTIRRLREETDFVSEYDEDGTDRPDVADETRRREQPEPEREGEGTTGDLEPSPSEPSRPGPPEPSGRGRETKTSPSSPSWVVRIRDRFAGIEWESFTGVRLFAWIGGLALFLGMTFLLRHAYEQGLINPTPRTRVIGAFLLGTGLMVGAVLIHQRQFRVTMHTFAAAGAAILYADVFAAYAYYNFIPHSVAFALMVLVTVTAFLLADRLRSVYVALLGLAGGFLTPPLLSTGTDNPLGLFGYVLLLDGALITLALRRRWDFLVALAAAATFVTEWGWTGEFFTVNKIWIGSGVFVLFAGLFAGTRWVADLDERRSSWIFYPAVLMPLLSMGFVLYTFSFPALGRRPGIVLTVLLLLDLMVGLLVVDHDRARPWHLLTGAVVFLLLLAWTESFLTHGTLYAGLSFYLAFGVLHGGLPVVLQRYRRVSGRYLWGHLYPSLMLVLMLYPVLRGSVVVMGLWPFVLVVCLLGMGLSWLMSWAGGVLINLLLVMAGSGYWIYHLPGSGYGLLGMLVPVVLFSLVFFGGGLLFTRLSGRETTAGAPSFSRLNTNRYTDYLPALSALLPYLLLVVMIRSLNDPPAGAVFGLALLLTLLLLGLVRYRALDVLAVVALAAVGTVEYTWHAAAFEPYDSLTPLTWYGIFYALFLLFPFAFRDHFRERRFPWIAGALVGVVQFLPLYDLVRAAMGEAYIGLLPAGLALITVVPLGYLTRAFPDSSSIRTTVLALFGGVTLLFVTLVFPLQFEKQWLTVAWALEGVALLWLFHRVPHRGLRWWGAGLLAVAFLRLGLNPAVLEYYPRGGTPILNWYLYAYGVVATCLFLGKRLINTEPTTRLRRIGRWLFPTLGTVLLFLLLNIEIADYFSTGRSLTFDFSGSLGQDATYSVAWALFGFGMLVVGAWRESAAARRASLGLLMVTTLKVFLHDLWRLGAMYRVASLIGLAVVLIVVSVLYQRFFSREAEP